MTVECTDHQSGVCVNEPATVADAAEAASRTPGFVLVTLSEPSADELTELAVAFDLPLLAVEDGLGAYERPKLDDRGDCLFVVVKSVHYDKAAMLMHIGELDVFVGSAYAIVIAVRPRRSSAACASASRSIRRSALWARWRHCGRCSTR